MSWTVQPVCLPIAPEFVAMYFKVPNLKSGLIGAYVESFGWGRTHEPFNITEFLELGVHKKSHLQSGFLRIISHQACLRNLRNFPGGQIQICAWDNFRDTCKGDSGGALVLKGVNGHDDVQVGIVSFGSPDCGNGLPGVYTRVEPYMPWIIRNIQKYHKFV